MPRKRTLKEVIGPGVSDQRYGSTTSLLKISGNQRANQRATSQAQRIDSVTYSDRNRSDPSGNADYTGYMRGAGSGTMDRMPGTTPSSSNTLTSGKKLPPKPKQRKRGSSLA